MPDQSLPTNSDAAEASSADAEDAPAKPSPEPAPPAARPAPRSTTAAPRIRIERGSTIYAPWKKDNPPPVSIKPGQVPPRPAAPPPAPVAPPAAVAPPAVAPVADAERTLEMTREMLAQDIAPVTPVQTAAPPPVKSPAPVPVSLKTPVSSETEEVPAAVRYTVAPAPPPVETVTARSEPPPAPPVPPIEPIAAPAEILDAPAESVVEEKSAAPENVPLPAETLSESALPVVAEPVSLPVEETIRPKTPEEPAPFVASPPAAEVRPILPDARLSPGQGTPPLSGDTGVLPRIDPARKTRRASSIPEQLAEAEAKFEAEAKAAPPTPYRLPAPTIPGYRSKNRENGKPPRPAPEPEPDEEYIPPEEALERKRIVTEEVRRFSPAAPGMARALAILGAIMAALGLLARPFSDWSSRVPFLSAIAHFSEGLESDSRFQWRNLRRREGRALSAGKRSQARVVVVLIPTKSGKGKSSGANLPAMDRRSVAGLMRLCNLAGVPAVGLAMDTATLPGSSLPLPPVAAPSPDPLEAVIREIRQSRTGPRPTFTVLPAFLTQEGGAGATGAPRLSLPDPRLSRNGLVTGFLGAPPAVSGAPDFASSPKNREPRRSFVLVTRAFPARDPEASFSNRDSLRRALSFPAAVALLCLPDAALWFQEGGAEREDSGIPDGLASVFSWPAASGAKTASGERPCAIDYGLLQTDPEGVEVVNANYLRGMSADARQAYLEGRPVIIGIDRPVDRLSTPLSSRLFGVLAPLKMRMTRAEIEGRAAAMLLARAERRAQSSLLPTLETDAEDRRGPNGEYRTETPGALFSVANIPPPAPYMEPLIPAWRSWLTVLPAALLGFFFVQAGRRAAAPPAPLYAAETARLRRILAPEMRLRRSVPALLCLALAGFLGWLWRAAGTAGFGAYLDFPGFWPWAAPWATALVTALAFGFFLLAAWILGPAFHGNGLGVVALLAALGAIILIVADFVLFPAGTPLLAPIGAFLIGAAIPLGYGVIR